MRKKRSKKINPILRILFLLVIIVGLGFFGIRKANYYKKIAQVEKVYAQEMEANTENKNLGKVKSILDYDTNYVIAAHYPKLEKESIDRIVFDFVDDNVLSFKEKLNSIDKKNKGKKQESENIPDLLIDYELYTVEDEIISIKFDVKEEISNLGINNSFSKVFNFAMEDDKQIELNDLLVEESLDFLSSLIYKDIASSFDLENENIELLKESISPSFNNFNNFMIKDNNIIFKLNSIKGINPEITNKNYIFKLEEFNDYSKYNLENGKKLSEEEVLEKIDNIKKFNKVRDHLDPNKPMVALTFDDGPYRNITIPILEVLEKNNAAATFFVLGNRVSGNEDILKRAIEGGSEIANHSYSHKQLTAIDNNELNRQIFDTQAAIKNAIGIEPTLLRPTYGAVNNNLKQTIDMPLILWSIDTLDWKYRNSQRIINHVLANVRDGDIILMHDMYPTTNQATQVLVPELVKRGYQLVTVSELYELKQIPLEGGKTYTNVR